MKTSIIYHAVARTCGVSISARRMISESKKSGGANATEFVLFETQGRGICMSHAFPEPSRTRVKQKVLPLAIGAF